LSACITNIGEFERDDDGDNSKGSGYGNGIIEGMFTFTLLNVEEARKKMNIRT
jgi:hypothetical protein